MTFPFDELNMRDGEHGDWVKSQRNEELWHAAAIAVLVSLGDPHGFVVWLMEQPETDRATAGYIFFGAHGSDYLRGQTDFSGEGLSGQEWLHTMQAICRRATAIGFSTDWLGLDPGFEVQRLACLDLIKRDEVADGIAIPYALLHAPFLPERKRRYFIEDGTVLEYDPGPFLS